MVPCADCNLPQKLPDQLLATILALYLGCGMLTCVSYMVYEGCAATGPALCSTLCAAPQAHKMSQHVSLITEAAADKDHAVQMVQPPPKITIVWLQWGIDQFETLYELWQGFGPTDEHFTTELFAQDQRTPWSAEQ